MVVALATPIPLTLANIGTYEIAFAIVFAGMGLPYDEMLAVGLAIHLAQLAFISVARLGAAVGLGLEIIALLVWAGIKTSMAQQEETATYPSTT